MLFEKLIVRTKFDIYVILVFNFEGRIIYRIFRFNKRITVNSNNCRIFQKIFEQCQCEIIQMKQRVLKSIGYAEDTFEKQVNLYLILILSRGDSNNKTFFIN